MDDRVLSLGGEVIPKVETWEDFGKEMDDFLEKNKNRLINDDFDIMIGFLRGGGILATVLHCKLNDKILYYGKEKKVLFRTIPKEISKKDYRAPCFVTGIAATEEELHDLDSLIKELNSLRYELLQERKINLLLVDDNLTGSTRLKYFVEKISSTSFVNVKTLAYTRHPEFFVPHLDYVIREFPKNKDYFVMPWHEKPSHPRTPQIEESVIPIWFEFGITPDFDLKEFFSKIVDLEFAERIEMRESTIDFKRGESQFYIEKKDNKLKLISPKRKYYPPKNCLDEKIPAFGNLSLCKLGGEMNQSNICRICSFLNCNRDLLNSLFVSEGFGDRIVFNPGSSNLGRNKELREIIARWIKENRRISIKKEIEELYVFKDYEMTDLYTYKKINEDLTKQDMYFIYLTKSNLQYSEKYKKIISVLREIGQHYSKIGIHYLFQDRCPNAVRKFREIFDIEALPALIVSSEYIEIEDIKARPNECICLTRGFFLDCICDTKDKLREILDTFMELARSGDIEDMKLTKMKIESIVDKLWKKVNFSDISKFIK